MPVKLMVLPSREPLESFRRPSITPIQFSTGSPFLHTNLPDCTRRTVVSVTTRRRNSAVNPSAHRMERSANVSSAGGSGTFGLALMAIVMIARRVRAACSMLARCFLLPRVLARIISLGRPRMEDILFARKGTMFNDEMIGRRITGREALALRQLLVDAMWDGQGYREPLEIALV